MKRLNVGGGAVPGFHRSAVATGVVMVQFWVAEGVVKAAREVEIAVPLVVRLAGTNVEAGRKILAESGLALITADTLSEAAAKAVAACESAKTNR